MKNPVAKQLRTPKFKTRTVENKKKGMKYVQNLTKICKIYHTK